MTTWTDLTAAEPDLADRALAILTATTNAVLGTIRRDGTPRLSGIDPFVIDGELWIGSMPGARKGEDLRRDPRLALHAVPWESRRLRDGATDPGEADAKLTGRAVLVDDPAAQDEVWELFRRERGVELPPGPADLFRIEPTAVVVVSVVDDLLQVDRWSDTDGRRTIRRS